MELEYRKENAMSHAMSTNALKRHMIRSNTKSNTLYYLKSLILQAVSAIAVFKNDLSYMIY